MVAAGAALPEAVRSVQRCRTQSSVFDVSHMGQCKITGADATAQFERFVPGDYEILKAGKQKYSLLLNKDGGIIDDLMAGRPDHDGLFVVVNAGNKDEDFAFWQANLEGDAKLTVLDDRALIAIQGPEAAEVMAAHEPILAEMGFMECARLMLFGVDCYVSRSGYTGEDGYEISVPADQAERVWNTILEDARVKPIGLGARDSLRLEAGLPLHGHDIDPTTSPVEGALTFALSKSRKERADFTGADFTNAVVDRVTFDGADLTNEHLWLHYGFVPDPPVHAGCAVTFSFPAHALLDGIRAVASAAAVVHGRGSSRNRGGCRCGQRSGSREN